MAKRTNVIRVDDDVQYLAALKPVNDLRAKKKLVKAIIDRLHRETGPEEFKSAVADVLASSDPVEAASRLDNSKALQAARDPLRLVTVAIDRAQAGLEKELVAAKARYVDRIRPQYREVATQFATALIAFGQAQEAAIEFEMKFRADGLGDWPGYSEGPLFSQKIGHPHNEDAIFATFLIAAVSAAVVDIGIIPKDWVDAWGLLEQIRKFGVDELPEPKKLAVTQIRGRAGTCTTRTGLFRRQAY